jgi:hypothetical protein
MRGRFLVPLLLIVVGAPACDSDTPLTTTTNAPTVTDTFADQTLTVNGAKIIPFSSTARGTVAATLTSISPDTAVIGVDIGTLNGTACQIYQANSQMGQGARTPDLVVSGVGNLCVHVYDPGTLTAPVTFSIDVSHP